jgi:probable rRNA maturation factor
LGSPDGELSILLVDDSRIADLNEKYLHRTGPTNVIAFPMRDDTFPDISPQLLGDVVISVDTALREADSAGLDIDRRISELLVHGILHLFGYDHERGEEAARKMEEKTRELLEGMELT